MTPPARYAAAIEVLDQIANGKAAEQALTTWARQHRFAGSKDRAAIRDHVFDALRAYRTVAALGGGPSGRAMILGLLRHQGLDPDAFFGADTYAPQPLSDAEREAGASPATPAAQANLPDWLWPIWKADLGDQAMDIATRLTDRAGVFLRVNTRRADRDEVSKQLAGEGIATRPVEHVKTALEVTENMRRVAQSQPFKDGLIELQDCSGQAAMLSLASEPAQQILDYCAGGGGKALALADLLERPVTAHDVDRDRMSDIPTRAARAGVAVNVQGPGQLTGRFDLVLCDAPCSGSGTWRRAPQAKQNLTAERLDELTRIQSEVLRKGAQFVAPGGRLAYATCSVLSAENMAQANDFASDADDFSLVSIEIWYPERLHDGFFLAVFRREA